MTRGHGLADDAGPQTSHKKSYSRKTRLRGGYRDRQRLHPNEWTRPLQHTFPCPRGESSGWCEPSPGNSLALVLSNSQFGNKPGLVQLPTMSVTLYTAPRPLIVSSQCFLVLCSTMATLNRDSNLLVLLLIGFLRGGENKERKGERRCL